jgi:MFS family permease
MTAAAATQTRAGNFKQFLDKHRSLDVYPTGSYRWGLVILTLIANVLCYFDLGLSGLLPLWMATLHFTPKDFGYFLTYAVVLSGIAGLFSGPLADRHGRIVVIYSCLVAQLILTFANLLMVNFWTFALVRGLMFAVAGVAQPALSGQIRDLTPRLGRATGYGLLGLGATASQFVWTFVPGVTLSRLHTWESQIWIMSIFGVALFIPSVLWLKGVNATFRLSVIETESSAEKVHAHPAAASSQLPESARAAFAALLRRWEIWVLVVCNVFIITVPITIQTFGPVMFIQSYKYTAAQASKMASYFFLAQTLFYLPGGLLSDFLRLRKALSFVLSMLLMGTTAWWAANFYHGLSPSTVAIICVMFGGLWSLAYVPWQAFYSEYLEDLDPALQSTGWSFFHAMFRLWLASAGFLQPIVAQHYGWAAWIWVVAVGIAIYMASLVVVPGYWRRSNAESHLRAAAAHS